MIRKLTVSLTVLMLTRGVAQDYVPITTDGSRWLYHTYSGELQLYGMLAADLGADTTINGEVYRLLDTPQMNCALRDDSGKVWLFPLDQYYAELLDSVPVLLYDFNLQVGDSFPIPRYPGSWAHVITRDSLQLLNGTYRDRIRFEPMQPPGWLFTTNEWIEGIGDPDYLLWALWDTFEAGLWLECYGIDNEPLFGPCLYLGQPAVAMDVPFELVPSGAYGRFKLTGPVEGIQGMSVQDAAGRESGTIRMLGGDIDLSQQVAGIYFLRIRALSGSRTIRFSLPQE